MRNRLDPLAVGQQIKSTYKRYLKTLLSPKDPAISRAFDKAIDASPLLTKGPLLELTPPYELGASMDQLIEAGVFHPGLRRINFPSDQPLYVHQETSIRKLCAGRNLVISTGTGSGKTESFLLPILNSLVRETDAGTLGPGVRALLLYPMNALANDQLKRLRNVLSTTPEITFGRYTGETKELARDAIAEFRAINRDEELRPNELLSREEMRKTPPHILLTNYAMLEYLLLRPADIDLFDGPYAGTWRFLVLDEAHVYDGAQGCEVALLLRRLRQRVAQRKALQCIATSASLTGGSPEAEQNEVMRFARKLFDAEFEFIATDPARQDLVTATRQQRRSKPSWSLGGEQLLRLVDIVDDGPVSAELKALGGVDDPADALHVEQLTTDLKAALANGPVDAAQLASEIWPPNDSEAVRKLEALVDLGSRVHDSAGNPVLSARYHMFVRATEGAFVSFADDGPRIFLGRHEVDPETGRSVFEFGTCQRCGAVHLAGFVKQDDGREYFVPIKNDASVRWLVLIEGEGDAVVDEDDSALGEEQSPEDPTLRSLCTGCGLLTDAAESQCTSAGCPGGHIMRVREHPRASRAMSRCTECGALAREVIRRLRTDINAAPAVITTALYQELPEAADESAAEVGGGRKLLMFSDSRQAAAFAAPYLDRTYGRLLERRYLTQALQDKKFCDEELTVEDLAIVVRRKALEAGHFSQDAGRIAQEKAANEWVVGELLTMDVGQSLEGLGLMRVGLRRASTPLPRALMSLGLTEEEGWSLLDELVKSARVQGAMTLLDEVDIKAERFKPRNTTVRIRSHGSDRAKKVISWLPSGRPGITNTRITFMRKVLGVVSSTADPGQVLDNCWRFLLNKQFIVAVPDKMSHDLYQVNHQKLAIRNGLRCEWYQCDVCRRTTAFSVRGVCPNISCGGRLQRLTIPDVANDTNHYRVIYQTMKTAPLSVREHTAQWHAQQAAAVQDEFIRGQVNVLSCSTTFELGVDVGDLQSVVMRNMPPTTANYIQRAGRAGRRQSSAALVVTYANRTSHDLTKYQQPESMIKGNVRIPWIPIDNERIGRRHAHSVALAGFFRRCAEVDKTTWSSAGEFFASTSDGQGSPASRVQAYLTPVPPEIRTALREVLPESVAYNLGVEDDQWVRHLCDLLSKVEQEVREDVSTVTRLMDEAARERKYQLSQRLKNTLNTIEKRELLGFLGNRNILPKYGFPVDTVELRTAHCGEPVGRNLDMARDLTLAIYEYAPGNEIVAGGKVWTSRGLYRMLHHELDTFKYRICVSCNRFQCGRELDAADPCPICGKDFGAIRTFVVPEFGFVADRDAHDVGTAPPERRWHGASYVVDVGDEVATRPWSSPSGIKVTARAGTRAVMAVISDAGGSGFQLCDWCGWADVADRRHRRRTHAKPTTGKDCDGPLSVVSLGHRYQTDIAEFTFDGLHYSHEAWLSALYALLEGASESLEISRDDIDGTLAWSASGHRSLVLFDTVPGGAGAAKKIAENTEVVLKSAMDRVDDCDCGPETSCYGCLRSYRNSRFHDQLSRNDALKVLNPLGLERA